MDISGKTIAIGVCGGIAAYRVCDLIRELYRRGAARVICLMTPNAQAFLPPLTLQALSREVVHTDTLATNAEGVPIHIALAQQADVLLVMPATADIMAKLAHGLADDLVSTTALTFTGKPVVIAPAMNHRMWHHPAMQSNINTLKARPDICFVDPLKGDLACGEYGEGHLAEQEFILRALYRVLHPQAAILSGVRAVVTAGGTREPIDPVRCITNRSSGKMGLALADELDAMGADVTLVSTLPNAPKRHYPVLEASTAEQLYEVLDKQFPETDLLVMAAAVSDFKIEHPAQEKLKKVASSVLSGGTVKSSTQADKASSDHHHRVTLVPNRDILATLASRKTPQQVLVGFAAETHEVERHAMDKLQRKQVDAIVANDIARPDIGFQAETNEVTVYLSNGKSVFIEKQPKSMVAREIINALLNAGCLPSAQGEKETGEVGVVVGSTKLRSCR